MRIEFCCKRLKNAFLKGNLIYMSRLNENLKPEISLKMWNKYEATWKTITKCPFPDCGKEIVVEVKGETSKI